MPVTGRDRGDRSATAAMTVSPSRFRKFGDQAGLVVLRAALVLAVGFALANSMQG